MLSGKGRVDELKMDDGRSAHRHLHRKVRHEGHSNRKPPEVPVIRRSIAYLSHVSTGCDRKECEPCRGGYDTRRFLLNASGQFRIVDSEGTYPLDPVLKSRTRKLRQEQWGTGLQN